MFGVGVTFAVLLIFSPIFMHAGDLLDQNPLQGYAMYEADQGISESDIRDDIWVASPQVIAARRNVDSIRGVVFEDVNRNGIMDRGEKGVPGVLVSNGRDWVRTDANGAYQIGVRSDMDLTIVQPSGWLVPTDHRRVPQFFYIHKPNGTGYPMRFGGLQPTGPAPAEVHFPIVRSNRTNDEFSCAIIGDSQTYSNEQIGWFRDSVVADMIDAQLNSEDCMIYVGDVVGDDLGLLDRLLEVGSAVGAPQWLVIGNHDIDFDARTNNDKSDTWRRVVGPNNFAFEIGNVLFIVLDNVFYPCDEDDVAAGHGHCVQGRNPSYNGRLTETQFTWLEGLIRNTPEDRLIVFNHHIPFVSFVDANSGQHQTDQLNRIHALVAGRQALSLSGHTHTTENHAPGQLFEGWTDKTGIGALPFRHIVAGAASGAWFQGDFSVDGVPMALQRMGAPMGYVHMEFKGSAYTEVYVGARYGRHRGQWIGVSTPDFRNWYDTIIEWNRQNANNRNPVPPFSINDLNDTRLLLPTDFTRDGGVWLTANVWMGSAETYVVASLSDGSKLTMERTQSGTGEAPRTGAEWADPFATARQLSVARHSFESELGQERAQGHELFRGTRFGPSPPQPQRVIADRNMHLWRVRLPELPLGVHRISVTSTDRNGITFTDTITLEVRTELPPRYWREELWR